MKPAKSSPRTESSSPSAPLAPSPSRQSAWLDPSTATPRSPCRSDVERVSASPRKGHFRVPGDPLISFLEQLRGTSVVYVPNPGNAGDGLIAYATYQLFAEFQIDAHCCTLDDEPRGQLLLFGGGGSLIEGLYSETYNFLKRALPQNNVVILPHTIHGYPDLIEETNRTLTIFCREASSYNTIRRLGVPGGKVHLAHDLAFYLRDEDLPVVGGSGGGTLNAFRIDAEATGLKRPHDNSDLSATWNGPLWTNRELCRYVSLSLASYISQFDVVQTNRLHIAILAAKLGKEVRLFPNSYYKIKAVFDHSFHESFDRVHFHYECSGKVEKPSAISSTIVAEQLQGELRNSVEWLEQQRSAWEQEAKMKVAELERLSVAMKEPKQENADK